jgi:choline monooxygenase
MDPLLARLPALPWSRLQRDPEGARTFEVRAHWALYCENYLEGLHIPYVHPTLSRRLELSRYRTEAHPWGVLQVGHDRGEGAGLPEDPRAPGAPVAAYYVFLFPNTMVNIYPWGVSLNVVTPLGLDRTRVDFDAWVWSPELRGVGAGDGLATVEDEDERVVEAVQRGVRARLYAGGRLAPGWEDGVGAFHRWLSGAYRATGKGAK